MDWLIWLTWWDCWWFCRLVAWSLGRLIPNARCLWRVAMLFWKTRGSINQLLTGSMHVQLCRSGFHKFPPDRHRSPEIYSRSESNKSPFGNPKKMSKLKWDDWTHLENGGRLNGDVVRPFWSRVSWWFNQIWDICGVRPGPFIPGSAGQAAINCRHLRIWSGSRPHGPQTERNDEKCMSYDFKHFCFNIISWYMIQTILQYSTYNFLLVVYRPFQILNSFIRCEACSWGANIMGIKFHLSYPTLRGKFWTLGLFSFWHVRTIANIGNLP